MSRLTAWGFKAVNAWKRLHLSYHGGKYSIQRALALDTYSKESSLLRVTSVCFGTPLPTTVIVLAVELVPLQDPYDGWKANYGFWIRAMVTMLIGIPVIITEATDFIDGLRISVCRRAITAVCTSLWVIGCIAAIASVSVFPIPFALVTITPVVQLSVVISFRLILGIRTIRQMLANRDETTRFMKFVATQFSLVYMYSAYEALFCLAKGSYYQLLVVFLLPVMKLCLKNVMVRCTNHKEDITPAVVIFTVDYFNAIYMATIMQSSSSRTTIITITVTDLLQTIVMLHTFNRRTVNLLSKLHVDPNSERGDLLSALFSLCQDATMFTKRIHTDVRIYSSVPHKLSLVYANLLTVLVKNARGNSVGHKLSHTIPSANACCFRNCSNKIYPRIPDNFLPTAGGECQPPEGPNSGMASLTSRHTLLSEVLETLFTAECLVVTAYLEAIIPFLYCCYVLMMVHLPNARYHTDMTGISRDNVNCTILPILLFGLLQIASLVLLMMLVKRNCGFSAHYQLAFVLNGQMPFIQVNLMLWIVLILSFRVLHFGVDFTFKFNWI